MRRAFGFRGGSFGVWVPDFVQEDGDVGEGAAVDAVAEVGEDFHLRGVAVGGEGLGGFDRGVGGEDVVVLSVDKEDGAWIRIRWEGWGDAEGAAAGDESGRFVGEGREGVERRHGALGEAQEGDVGQGDIVMGGDLGDEVIEVARCGLEAGLVAEGPAHVAEPLVAVAVRRAGRAVGAVDGQTFPKVTEGHLQGGGEGDEVVARGTKTV